MISKTITQSFKGECIVLKKDWVRIENISPNMVKAVIAAEDNLL
jgi:membrane peptidoglycan carboxypeptidase